MSKQVAFNIYPTLLDGWSYFLSSDMTEEDFLARINRKEPPTEQMMKGRAFNNVIDSLCDGYLVEKMVLEDGSNAYKGYLKEGDGEPFTFLFDMNLCNRFVSIYMNSIRQAFVEFEVKTGVGLVRYYGYADGVFKDGIGDIKTVSRYRGQGTYRNHWQPYVYLHALKAMGGNPKYFRFDITDFRDYWEEYYRIEDFPLQELINETESLCKWMKEKENLIESKKIFGK